MEVAVAVYEQPDGLMNPAFSVEIYRFYRKKVVRKMLSDLKRVNKY